MNQYYFKQNEVITDEDNNIYNPNYSTKDSDFYFENILKDFVSSKFASKVYFNKINCLPVILQDLFWIYSFNFTKYKEKYVFKQHSRS